MTMTSAPRTNRFEAPCRKCGRTVEPGAGRLINVGFNPVNRAKSTTSWRVECLDRAICDATYNARPEVAAKRDAQAEAWAAKLADADKALADLEAAGRVHDEYRAATFTMPGLGSGKRVALKRGVRVKFAEAGVDFDYVSIADAIVGLSRMHDWRARDLEGQRIKALPLPPVGATYARQYRHGCKFNGTEVESAGRAMFLGIVRVDRVGDMAVCAELMTDGSWLGFRDGIHTIKRQWEIEQGQAS